MKPEDIITGRLYLIRGWVRRSAGPYVGRNDQDQFVPMGPNYAFHPPRSEGGTIGVGYSADPEQVRQEVTAADLPWLKRQRTSASEQGSLDLVADLDHVIAELTKAEDI